MKPKHQRLTLALLAVVALLAASLLAMSALKDKASYFYAPSDIARTPPAQGQAIRLGGMVTKGSIVRASDGVTIGFIVHDEAHSIPVTFRGIAPDLFKEDSGVVAEGSLRGGRFVATNLLAKHDERYMPPQQAGAEHVTKTLKR